MTYTIAQPRHICIGAGALGEVGEVARRLDLKRPLVVTDQVQVSMGVVDIAVAKLRAAGMSPEVFSGTVPDPTSESLVTGLEALRAGSCDGVIGLGGGSSLDTAKALALLAVSGGPMARYKSPHKNVGAIPIIAVPTTAGSGSEATSFTVITDSDTGEKMLCAGPAFLPSAAIVDYELTLSMPPRLTADTGIDALTHAVEAYVSVMANPFTDALCLSAISTISRNIRRVHADGSDPEARASMMLASTQAGIAFSNSSVALVHGMSRPLGAHFHVAHGMSNAMLFPAVTAFSAASAPARYAACARALGAANEGASDASAAGVFADSLATLCHELEVPTPASYGLNHDRWNHLIPVMVEQALASGSPQNNPRVPTSTEMADLYREIYA